MKPILLVPLLTAGALLASPPPEHAHDEEECCELNLWTGEGVSIGNWLFPEVNYQAVAGSSTIDPARLAVGHHDPDRHGITQQAFEVAATIRLNPHISFFGTYSGKVDLNDHWLSEFEEYYAILDLPADIRVRGGRLQPRFGYHNELHLHDFSFIDQYLASGRMFGEDPLVIYGGEVSLPVLRNLPAGWDDRLTVSFGAVPDPDDEGHAHEGEESLFEGEGSLFADWAATANYRLGYNATSHTRYELGFAGAWGGNEFGRHTQMYGLHFEYLWRADGIIPAGGHQHHADSSAFFRWRTEVFVRHFGAVSEGHEHEESVTEIPAQPEVREVRREFIGTRIVGGQGAPTFVPVYRTREVVVSPAVPAQHIEAEEDEHEPARLLRDEFTDLGIYSTLTYGFPGGKLQAHLRGEYVSGVPEAGLSERFRISPALAWRPSEKLPIHFKIQYNYDHSPDFGDEHSVWAQFNLSWGDCCAH